MPDTRLILHVKGTEAETTELPKEAVKAAFSEGKLSQSQLIWSPKENTWKQLREMPELMPGETLILHVKGTESQTKELPKRAIRAAVSKGEMTHSQLIWSPKDNAWKQLREMPELMPGETLILHVKGTESQTKELPKQAIRTAVSKGEMTQSQLIWSPEESAWKQLREMPELMPGETLILHVQGTEAQTQELPKDAVRYAIAQGKISQSQLIWSAAESAWKQVREWPELSPGETLILHVKGTEAQTAELPKKAVRVGISKGDISHSQLIWSSAENQWKQVRQMPDLLPSQKLAPAPARAAVPPRTIDGIMPEAKKDPVPRAASTVQAPPRVKVAMGPPRVVATPTVSAQPQVAASSAEAPVQPRVAVAATATPHVRVASADSAAPRVRVAAATPSAATPQARVMPVGAAGAPQVRAAATSSSPSRSHVVKEEEGPSILKWICIGLAALIALVVGANYFLVDRSLVDNIRDTPYATVPVYGHYGAFIQPNVIVIHIPPSKKITPDNITDFLVELAHSTPDNAITGDIFTRVALTSGWTAQYSFSGYSWKQLGDMEKESPAQREEFIMSQMGDAAGTSVLPESTLNQEAQEEMRQQIWNKFIAHFITQP